MIALALGIGVMAALFWAADAFSRARVEDLKGLLAWVVALAGLVLAAMLLLTGRWLTALVGLALLGPLAWTYWRESRGRRAPAGPRMTRTEALAVLGLAEGASESDVRAAWVRLIFAVRPQGGGSDNLTAQINEAKDVLLGQARR